jgi:hypothetical protein
MADLAQTLRELNVFGKIKGGFNGDFFNTSQDPGNICDFLIDRLLEKNMVNCT